MKTKPQLELGIRVERKIDPVVAARRMRFAKASKIMEKYPAFEIVVDPYGTAHKKALSQGIAGVAKLLLTVPQEQIEKELAEYCDYLVISDTPLRYTLSPATWAWSEKARNGWRDRDLRRDEASQLSSSTGMSLEAAREVIKKRMEQTQ